MAILDVFSELTKNVSRVVKVDVTNLAGLFNPYAASGLFSQYKMMQKKPKMSKTLALGYSSGSTQRVLSNEYQHDRVGIIFKNPCALMLWMEVALALEGLKCMLMLSTVIQ